MIRLNDEEFASLKKLENGRPFAVMCREILLNNLSSVELVERTEVVLDHETVTALNKIGSNLNQIARQLNSVGSLPIGSLLALHDISKNLTELINDIKALKK